MTTPVQLQEYLGNIYKDIGDLKNKINNMKMSTDEIRSLDSIPKEYIGKAIPAREAVEIFYPFYVERIQGNITIPADGPFVATSIHFAFISPWGQEEQGFSPAGDGRFQRISYIEDDESPASLFFGYATVKDFYWEYEVSESHKKRQNIQVPSSLVHQEELGNGFFPLVPCDVFPKTSTVTIYVTTLPRYVMDDDFVNFGEYYQQTGNLWCGFNGYYILEDY
jgi:hypothetical protein